MKLFAKFSGRKIYRTTRGKGVDADYPKDVTEEFPGLPQSIDAGLSYVISFQNQTYYMTYLFAGTSYYMLDFKTKSVSLEMVLLRKSI